MSYEVVLAASRVAPSLPRGRRRRRIGYRTEKGKRCTRSWPTGKEGTLDREKAPVTQPRDRRVRVCDSRPVSTIFGGPQICLRFVSNELRSIPMLMGKNKTWATDPHVVGLKEKAPRPGLVDSSKVTTK